MKRQSRVVWAKGLFLTPQLFEAQDRFFEGSLQFRSSLQGFAPWGITKVEIEPAAVINRKIQIVSCSGILNDGFAFSMPGTASLPRERSFSGLFTDTQDRLDVFLALPARREGERNSSRPDGPSLRYVIEDENVCNDVDGEEETIEVARPRFEILFSGEAVDRADTLHIARIQRSAGTYLVDPEFIPPCLNVACNLHLWDGLLKVLLERMAFVSEQLAKQRSDRSELLAHFEDSDIRRFWVLDLVNRSLPELSHIHSVRYCHPEELYRFLLKFRGSLCTFFREKEYRPNSGFEKYDHYNLGGCLPPLVAEVERMLKILVFRRRRCQMIQPEAVERGRHFKSKLTKEFLGGNFYLAVLKDPYVSVQDLEVNLKVVGSTTVKDAGTLAGLHLSHEVQAPADCPRKEGYVYFRILAPSAYSMTRPARPGLTPLRTTPQQELENNMAIRRNEVWQDVQQNEEIRIVILNQLTIADLELLVVLPEAEGYSPLPEMSNVKNP